MLAMSGVRLHRVIPLVTFLGGSLGMFAIYQYVANKVDSSCLLVRQTINVLKSDAAFANERSNLDLASGVGGSMNQRKGFADITFTVVNSHGIALLY